MQEDQLCFMLISAEEKEDSHRGRVTAQCGNKIRSVVVTGSCRGRARARRCEGGTGVGCTAESCSNGSIRHELSGLLIKDVLCCVHRAIVFQYARAPPNRLLANKIPLSVRVFCCFLRLCIVIHFSWRFMLRITSKTKLKNQNKSLSRVTLYTNSKSTTDRPHDKCLIHHQHRKDDYECEKIKLFSRELTVFILALGALETVHTIVLSLVRKTERTEDFGNRKIVPILEGKRKFIEIPISPVPLLAAVPSLSRNPSSVSPLSRNPNRTGHGSWLNAQVRTEDILGLPLRNPGLTPRTPRVRGTGCPLSSLRLSRAPAPPTSIDQLLG